MSASTPTSHKFQAEVSQVLSLVINSLYSNKEIFARELVSNASDALDKVRFKAVTEPEVVEGGAELRIRIHTDKDGGTLTVSDNGIGMTEEELVKHLGTVAHSGTQAFLAQLQERAAEAKDESGAENGLNLIGQFGVGFYSAFLVADKVEVITRAAGTKQGHKWISDGVESFTIEPTRRVEQGTDIVLHLKEEHREYLEEYRVRELVKRYSDYIAHPVDLQVQRDDKADWERINEASALWRKTPSSIGDEQYNEFYQHLSHDFEAPVARRHIHIEGTLEFTLLLFVPKRAPFDLMLPDARHGVRLYVKRVFIMDNCDELLPRWLRFVRGVVDSEDLPLNVSRELLQDSKAVKVIRKQITKQALEMIGELAETEHYAEFWETFGAVLKEGLMEPEHRERLAKLVRYGSSRGEGLVSLADYVEKMPEDQPAIYYTVGVSRDWAAQSPHLEGLKKRGYEVLFMTDPIDEWASDAIKEFEGKPLVSALREDLKLPDDKADDSQDADSASDGSDKSNLGALMHRFREILDEHISEARVSPRLTDSPVCLVLPEDGVSPYVERLLRLQQKNLPKQKRILEINAGHPVIESLRKLNEADPTDEAIREWMELLYDQALLAEGSPIEEPARFAARLTKLLTEVVGSRVSQ